MTILNEGLIALATWQSISSPMLCDVVCTLKNAIRIKENMYYMYYSNLVVNTMIL